MEIVNIYDDALHEIQRRGVEDWDKFAPYFVISFACHAFNLMNEDRQKEHQKPAYTNSGQIPNMRLHLLFMAPPGCGKTFFLKQYSNKYAGILKHAGHPLHMEGSMTEAGLIGTVKVEPDGSTVTVPGAAREHSTSVFIIDEFMAMMTAMKAGHNSQLEAMLLTALDSGDVSKRLAHGPVEYHTSFTLWCGIQPIKANLEGGLGRRFCFLLNVPTPEDQERYAEAAMTSDNIPVDIEWLIAFRKRVELWTSALDLIEDVTFEKGFYNLLRRVIKCAGYEVDVYRRIALGYHLARKGASERVHVVLDEDLTNIMIQQAEWRHRINQGPRIQQIMAVLKTCGYMFPEGGMFGMTKAEMISHGATLQLSAGIVHDILLDAARLGYIKIRGTKICMEPMALMDSPVISRAKMQGIIQEEVYKEEFDDSKCYDNLGEREWDDMIDEEVLLYAEDC